nr:DEAD-box ATP-dependent RNA helicase 7-like [Ipomoea batatas]
MPSVIVAEAMASEASKDLKKKGKKTPKPAAETLDSEKKKSRRSKVDSESDSEGSSAEKKRSKKKEKKRKAAEIDSGDEQRSETSSELVDPVNFKAEKKKKAKFSLLVSDQASFCLVAQSGSTGLDIDNSLKIFQKSNISRIERESGVKFEHIAAPQPKLIFSQSYWGRSCVQIAGIF